MTTTATVTLVTSGTMELKQDCIICSTFSTSRMILDSSRPVWACVWYWMDRRCNLCTIAPRSSISTPRVRPELARVCSHAVRTFCAINTLPTMRLSQNCVRL